MEISLLGNVVPFGSSGTTSSEPATPPTTWNATATRQDATVAAPLGDTTLSHLSYELFPPTRSGVVFDPSTSTNLDYGYDVELFIDGSRVIWSQGGVLRKIISFEAEREPIHQAFFAWFTSNAGQGTSTSPTSATGSTVGGGGTGGGDRQHSLDDFDFDRYSYSALSENPTNTPPHPHASVSGMRQALVIFLNNVAKVYFHDGEVLVVPLPIAVRRAWPMSLGIVIEAVPYEDMPLFYNMFDPIEEFREIHIKRASSQPDLSQSSDSSRSYETGRNQHIVFMSQSEEDEKIALTFDSEARRHRLWRYVLKPRPEIPYGGPTDQEQQQPVTEHDVNMDDSEMDIDLMMQVDAGLFEVHSDIQSASESSAAFLAHALNGSTVVCIFDQEAERLSAYTIGPGDVATQLWTKPVRAAISVVATRPFQRDILVCTLDHQLQLWTGSGSEFHLCRIDLGRSKKPTGSTFSTVALDALLGSLKTKFAPPAPEPRIVLMRDSVEDRVSFVLDDGRVLRVQLALRPRSAVIRQCFDAIAYVLPIDLFCELRQRFLSLHFGQEAKYKHVPSLGEWDDFVTALLSFCEPSLTPLTISSAGTSRPQATLASKNASKAETDWAFFLESTIHAKVGSHPSLRQGLSRDLPAPKTNIYQEFVMRAQRLATVHPQGPATRHAQRIDAYLKYILVALHLVFEDRNLDVIARTECSMMPLLLLLAKMVGWSTWVDHYLRRDFSLSCESKLIEVYTEGGYIDLKGFERKPPDILEWIATRVSQRHLVEPFPSLDSIMASWSPQSPPALMGSRPPLDRLRRIQKFYNALMFTEYESERDVVTAMRDEKFSRLQLNQLPVAVGLPLKEAIWRWRRHPPPGLDPGTYAFIGRDDMAELTSSGTLTGQYLRTPTKHAQTEVAKRDVHTICEEQDVAQADTEVETTGTEITESDITDLRFGSDRRIAEVQRMLTSSTTIKIKTTLDSVDEELLRPIHQEVLRKVALRTLALPVGRGIFTYGTTTPVTTQKFPIPPIQLAVNLVPVYGVTEFDTTVLGSDNAVEWSHFHNGVAAGLRISPNSTDVNSSWIIFNRPDVLDSTHAGFLCALGLTGHLRVLARPQVLRYLTAKHPMTSMGLLLGLASTYCGTMDTMITKLLSIHIPALLPQRSSELSLSFMTQVAAILGIGLVYMESSHRRMAEIMLDEIGLPSDPSGGETANMLQESHSLAAGFALGFITLGQGNKPMGLRDMRMVDVLVGYMPGSQHPGLDRHYGNRGLSNRAKAMSSSSKNRAKAADQTGAGAVVAMGLMYLRTGSVAIAAKIDVPDTPYMLDFIKPDTLLLRVICKSIILWDSIIPTKDWILSHIPEYLKTKDGTGVPSSETHRQSYYSIIAGACYAIGIRFAGSNDETAYKCVLQYMDQFMSLSTLAPMEGSYEESITKSTIRTCLDATVLASAMIVAGSGRIDFMRRIRKLHRRVKTDVSYGGHMAYHMALGLLFLGGGGYTLGTSNRCVAALLCSLFPRLPSSPSDNRSHLQSFRHLWVLAVEPRCLVTRDASTGECCPVPVRVHLKPVVFQRHVQMGLPRKNSVPGVAAATMMDWTTEHHPHPPGHQATTTAMQPVESPSRLELMSPCLLPDLSTISKIEILGPRYWPITLEVNHGPDDHDDASSESIQRIWRILRSRSILVKRHIGHMSYMNDLLGMRGILARPIPRVLIDMPAAMAAATQASLEEGGPQRRKRARMDALAFQNRLYQPTGTMMGAGSQVDSTSWLAEQRSVSYGDDFGLTFLQDPQVAAFANYLCRAQPLPSSLLSLASSSSTKGGSQGRGRGRMDPSSAALLRQQQKDDARAAYFTAVLYECLTMDKVEVLDAHVWLYEIQTALAGEDNHLSGSASPHGQTPPSRPQISWQSLRELQILGRYYEHWRSQQNMRFEQENTSTMTMRNGWQKVNTDHHHHPSSSSYHPEDDDGSETLFKIRRVTKLLAMVNLCLERHQGLYLTSEASQAVDPLEDEDSMEIDKQPSLSQDTAVHAMFERQARVYFETGCFSDPLAQDSGDADEETHEGASAQKPTSRSSSSSSLSSKTDWFKVWLEFHRIPGPDTVQAIRKAIQKTAETDPRLQKLSPMDKQLRLKQAFSIAFGSDVPLKVFDYLIDT
ncbi:Anaphase-promoting complex subunit 1 [Actinomortierella ambigua]|nr:Anaphase-promoting complex subunit 1 [Actinomortierella ambigua]